MLSARTFSVSINHHWQALYEWIWRPQFFSKWASGLVESGLRQEGDQWLADGPQGLISIRFTPHNAHGVMDHVVDIGDGTASRTKPHLLLWRGRGQRLFAEALGKNEGADA